MIMQRSAVVTAGIILFTNVGGNVGVFAFQPGMPTGNVNTNQPRTSTCTVVHASLDDNNSNNSPKRNKIRLGSLKRAARKKIAVGAAFALTLLQAGSPASAAAARSARPIKNQPPPVETNAHEAKQRLPIVGASVIVATGVSFKRYFFRNNMYDEDDEPSLDQEIRRKRFDEIMGIQAPPVRERDILEDDEIMDQSMVNEEAEANEKKSMVEEWFKRAVADAEPKLNEDDTFVGYEDENDYDDEIKSDVIVSEDVHSFGDSAEEVDEKDTIAYEEIILAEEPLGGVEEETTGFLSSISKIDFIPELTSTAKSRKTLALKSQCAKVTKVNDQIIRKAEEVRVATRVMRGMQSNIAMEQESLEEEQARRLMQEGQVAEVAPLVRELEAIHLEEERRLTEEREQAKKEALLQRIWGGTHLAAEEGLQAVEVKQRRETLKIKTQEIIEWKAKDVRIATQRMRAGSAQKEEKIMREFYVGAVEGIERNSVELRLATQAMRKEQAMLEKERQFIAAEQEKAAIAEAQETFERNMLIGTSNMMEEPSAMNDDGSDGGKVYSKDTSGAVESPVARCDC